MFIMVYVCMINLYLSGPTQMNRTELGLRDWGRGENVCKSTEKEG